MPGLLQDWQKAKKSFEIAAKKKPPKEEFLGFYRKGTGITPALKKLDSASNADQAAKAKKEFDKARDQYLKFLKTRKEKDDKPLATSLTSALDRLLADIDEISLLSQVTVTSKLEKITKFIDDDLAGALKRNGLKVERLELPDKDAIAINVALEGDKQADNAVLVARLDEAARDVINKKAADLATDLNKIDKALATGKKADALETAAKKAYAKAKAEIKKDAPTKLSKVLADAKKDKKEYADYKIKAAVSVTTKSVGIVASTATTIAGGFTGAGTIIGLVSLAKSTISLITEASNLWKDADKFGNKIAKNIASLKKQSAKVAGGREVAGEVLNRLTGIRANTVATVETDVGQYKSKLTGCRDNALKSGSQVTKLMEANTEFGKTIKQLVPLAKKAPDVWGRSVAEMAKTFKKQEAELDKVLKYIDKQNEMNNNGKDSLEKFEKFLDEAKDDVPAWAEKVNKYAVPFLDLAYVNWSDAANQAVAITKTLGNIAIELEQKALDVKKETDNLVKGGQMAQTTATTIGKFLSK